VPERVDDAQVPTARFHDDEAGARSPGVGWLQRAADGRRDRSGRVRHRQTLSNEHSVVQLRAVFRCRSSRPNRSSQKEPDQSERITNSPQIQCATSKPPAMDEIDRHIDSHRDKFGEPEHRCEKIAIRWLEFGGQNHYDLVDPARHTIAAIKPSLCRADRWRICLSVQIRW